MTHLGLPSIYLYICRKLLQFRQREKRVVNAKKRSSQPEKSGENSAYAHKKSLFCYFLEKASMENHFGFCALKNPQTRMNTKKNVPDSKIRHIIWWRRMDSNHRSRRQQIYSLPPLATRELLHMQFWSWWTDSNPRPADYKSASIPTELHQHWYLLVRSED